MDNYSDEAVNNDNLDQLLKKLDNVQPGPGGAPIKLSGTDLSLLKQMISNNAGKTDDFIRIIQICDFLDEEEANRELEAYYEAVRLGMSTEYNIAHALSRASTNRKGSHSHSRVAALLDAMSHQKFTSNQPGVKPPNKNDSPLG